MIAARWLLGLLALASIGVRAEEFEFDASRYQKKTFEFTGYVEARAESFRLNRDGAFYKLAFFDQPQRDALGRDTLTFKPSARLGMGESATAYARAHAETQRDDLGESRASRFDEAYVSWKARPGTTVDAGKMALKWGKGYAWNPVGFVERAKDPNDPELAREGFTVLAADLIRSFDGPLQTAAFTPVLVPVSSRVNGDFGEPGHVNVAAKLYLLYRDTDLDFMVADGGSRPRRYGFDFSRNLGSTLEIHGEWARAQDAQRPVVDAQGRVSTDRRDAVSWLLGARYLSERDTTTIVEYYRNGSGYDDAQSRDFYGFVDAGVERFRAAGDRSLLERAAAVSGQYGRPNPNQRYLYVRISQKEPFDLLYFSPAVTFIANVEDRSGSVAPELLYTGITNLELRLRAFFLGGGRGTDFGEKQNARRIELLARLYF
jgi:hypothetical protein